MKNNGRTEGFLNTRLRRNLIFCFCFGSYALAFAQQIDKSFVQNTGISLKQFNKTSIGNLSEKYEFQLPDLKTSDMRPRYMLGKNTVRQGFFCRIETQIGRRSLLAPRFRLGSLDYTNWLEGKSVYRE